MRDATPAGPVSATLLMSLCWSLSCFQPLYQDEDGGEGLFAMRPADARLLLPEGGGLTPELFHPATAVFLAARYLSLLLKVFQFDVMFALLAFRYGLRTVLDEAEALVEDPDNIRYVTDTLKTMAWLWEHQPGRHAMADPHHKVYPN
jgi:hypothetical protein